MTARNSIQNQGCAYRQNVQIHEVFVAVLHSMSKNVYNIPEKYDTMRLEGGLFLRQWTVKFVLGRLGCCGKFVLFWLLRQIGLALWGILMVAVEIFGVLLRGLAYGADMVAAWVRERHQNAVNAAKAYRMPADSRFQSVLRMTREILFGRQGMLLVLFRYSVPVMSCLILFGVVRQFQNRQYGIAVAVDGNAMGMIEEEADYFAAEKLVRERLSGSETAQDISFQRSFQLRQYDGSEKLLSAGELADKMLEQANIALTEAYGVYVSGEFQGAVSDTHPIEAALARLLGTVSDQYGGVVEEVRFADTISYEKAMYPEDSLIAPQKLANQLTASEHSTRNYIAGRNDTIYSIAERFSTTPAELRRLNPNLPEVMPLAQRVKVPIVKRRLPVICTKKSLVLTFQDYQTVRTETNSLLQGQEELVRRGVMGEKECQVLITYTDGVETAREELSAIQKVAPVDAEIAVGTLTAQPYSTDTVVDGNGKYIWPVDGGKITDLFGGEREHGGLDIGAAEYSEIYAVDNGKVLYAGSEDGYGNFVLIQHDDGYYTLYAHCVELLTETDAKVRRGDVIALVGNTGDSTGAHLHFEVRDPNGVRLNPALYLRVNVD